MKKFTIKLITLLCIFSLAFTFTACKNDNKKDKDKDVKGEEVTKDEWTAAFDLSKIETLTLKISENISESYTNSNEKYQESLTTDATYKNGVVTFEMIEKEDGETDREGPYDEVILGNTILEIFDKIGDTEFRMLVDIINFNSEASPTLEDCGNLFSYFVYSQKEGCYTATFSFDDFESVTFKIWFTNAKISKMTMKATYSVNDYQCEISGTCNFKY